MSATTFPATSPGASQGDPRSAARVLGWVSLAVVGLTAGGALLGLVFPALGPAGSPRPTLVGTPGEVFSIFANNLRVFAAGPALVLCRWTVGRTRTVGDVVLGVVAGGPVLTVGLAIGRHGGALLPYLPHLGLEWAALCVSLACWVVHRGRSAQLGALLPYAAATLVLAIAAAAVEVYAVPHR